MHPDGARGEVLFDAPQFLPDGRHYLFSALGVTPEQSGVYVAALGVPDRRLVLRSTSWAAFAPQGYLLFQRDATLFAQRFDPSRLELAGEPERLVDGVYVSTWRRPTAWVAGDTLAFVAGDPRRYQLTWLDRAGRMVGRAGDPANIITFDLSPDGTRVVAQIDFPGSLWLMDTSRGASRQLTRAADDADPRFSGDGKAVLFDRGVPDSGIYRLSLDGGRQVAVLREGAPPRPYVSDWSRDGRVALYAASAASLWSVPVSGDGPPRPVVESTGMVDQARFSPDGRWVAFNGDETGRMEVFVVPYPPTGERWQVSTAGGVQPQWRGDGRELFYLDPRGALMSADVDAAQTFSSAAPRVLFRTELGDPSGFTEDYGVAGDGERFLFRLPAADSRPRQMKLVLDWTTLLGRQGPGETVR
jgi:dipeptidyl aminopeptidase/acylaminoacyl peptidase